VARSYAAVRTTALGKRKGCGQRKVKSHVNLLLAHFATCGQTSELVFKLRLVEGHDGAAGGGVVGYDV
jgi:hypothetical protein